MLKNLLFLSLGLQAFAGQTLAILNFNTDQTLNPAQVASFQQRLSSFAAEAQEWVLIERNQMDVILNEQGFQQSGVCEKECQIEMGRLLGADLLVMGSIARMGKQWSITASLVDVASGKVLRTSLADVKTEEDLVGEPVREMVRKLRTADNTPLPEKKKSSTWAWVTGGVVLIGAAIGGVVWAMPGKTVKQSPEGMDITDEHK